MKINDLIKTSLKAITANKLQSFLSMLGIIIGIGAVVTIVSISEGAKVQIQSQIADMGTNTISASIYGVEQKGLDLDADDLYPMTNSKYINYITVETNSGAEVEYNEQSSYYSIYGVDTFYDDYKDITINGGRFIDTADILENRLYCVIGSDVASDNFGSVNPIGSYLNINTTDYSTGETTINKFFIIGVLNEKDSNGFASFNGNIYIPYTTSNKVLNTSLTSFYIVGNDTDTLTYAQEDAQIYIESLIYPYISDELNGEESTYNDYDDIFYGKDIYEESVVEPMPSDGELEMGGGDMNGYVDQFGSVMTENPVTDYYYLFNTGDFIESAMQMVNTITVMISGVAAISLLVGGIGIANVMFMTVLERTKEIGLRKAVGATNKDIILQFLIQAIFVTMIGGFFGLLVGYGGSMLIGLLVSELTPVVNFNVALAVFLVSTAVGILAGIFPARRAAKLNPIDALRYE